MDLPLSKDCGEIKDVQSIKLLSQQFKNFAKSNKSSPEPYAKSQRSNDNQSSKQAHDTHSNGKPVLSELSFPITGPDFSGTNQHSTPNSIMEENMRMRKAIDDAVLALTRKIHAPSEQTKNVFLMFNMLKESERKQNKLRRDLEAMANKIKARESEWAAERLAFEEKEQANKRIILTLREENYKLLKSRSKFY